VISEYLGAAGVRESEVPALATWLLAGVEGLAIERLEGYQPERLEAARGLFVRSVSLIARNP
jgi:hypothetical protein